MKLLIDTHLLIWALTDDMRFPKVAAQMMGDPENNCYFSVVSAWEVAVKHTVRPDNILFTGVQFSSLCRTAGFFPLDLSDRCIPALETLRRAPDAPPHKDPFDRMLIAQAKSEGMRFLTHDGLLSGYGENCVILV